MAYRRILLTLILVFVLFGCKDKNNTGIKTSQQITQQSTSKTNRTANNATHITADDTIPDISIPSNAIQINDSIITTTKIHVVGNGNDIYSKPFLGKLNWKTLTFNNYLRDTKIILKRERYPAGTEDEGNIGLFISSTDKDAQLLISGLTVSNRRIDTIHLKKNTFYPGQKEIFDYKGTTYTFYATGHKIRSMKKGYDNYKLFLTATVKGHTFNQLIASEKSNFGDTEEAEILSHFSIGFVGDIDGDNIPDIITTSTGNFYYASNLYLSSIAGDKAIYKNIPIF